MNFKNLTYWEIRKKNSTIFCTFPNYFTNYNTLFRITKNNCSDSDNNKIKLKKIKKDAIQSRRQLMPHFLFLNSTVWKINILQFENLMNNCVQIISRETVKILNRRMLRVESLTSHN